MTITTITRFCVCVCVLSAWVFAGSGCAAGAGLAYTTAGDTISKPYSPVQQQDSPIPETKSIVWEKLLFNPTLPHQPLAVGIRKSGFGTEPTSSDNKRGYIFLNTRPKKWLTEAAKLELKSVGLDVGNENANDPRISIIVDQFFVEYYKGFSTHPVTAVTILDVRVTIPNKGKMFQRWFVGEVVADKFILPSNNYLIDTLLKSAQFAFHEAAQKTRKLIDREER